jgi:hypothetical protein
VSRYCPDDDPIIAAGSITCGACGEQSYPLAAEWFGDRLILATFDQHHTDACRRRHGHGAVLVILDAESDDIPAVQRPRMCRAVASTTGRPCRSAAQPGSGYCHWHSPERQGAR